MDSRNNIYGAFDIGGTKCAALIGCLDENEYKILGKSRFPTSQYRDPYECIARLCGDLAALKKELDVDISAIGISCGGPLDNVRGVIQSPPNLPGWDDIPICDLVEQLAGVPAFLENDANAGALAEWRYGAGRGAENMLFLTFGTGLGAGVIAGGSLLYGGNGNAGELGHIRLAPDGPVGYGKAGSFEGFCSGSGLAQQMKTLARTRLASGDPVAWGSDEEMISQLDARKLSELAEEGDADALAIFENCGKMLGCGLAIAVDLFNPEKIVIGSMFVRCEKFLRPAMEQTLTAEALGVSRSMVSILPASLGESAGDVAALCAARENFMEYSKIKI